MTYVAELLKRIQLRNVALELRAILGMEQTLYFPVLQFLECIMPVIFEGFHVEIVPVDMFAESKHADTDIANRCIRIREDIYYRAVEEHGRDRMTVAHEIAHYVVLIVCGVKFDRAFDIKSIARYEDPEWHAKALAGELLCPHHLIKGLTVEQIAQKCGVSMEAAKFSARLCKGGDAD